MKPAKEADLPSLMPDAILRAIALSRVFGAALWPKVSRVVVFVMRAAPFLAVSDHHLQPP
jgi:hypothetical protein